MWEGAAWPAALLEARAHLASAEGRDDEAVALTGQAAAMFRAAGHVLDAHRCEEAPASVRPVGPARCWKTGVPTAGFDPGHGVTGAKPTRRSTHVPTHTRPARRPQPRRHRRPGRSRSPDPGGTETGWRAGAGQSRRRRPTGARPTRPVSGRRGRGGATSGSPSSRAGSARCSTPTSPPRARATSSWSSPTAAPSPIASRRTCGTAWRGRTPAACGSRRPTSSWLAFAFQPLLSTPME